MSGIFYWNLRPTLYTSTITCEYKCRYILPFTIDSSDRSSTRINEMTESCKVIYPSLFTVINKVSFSSRNSSFSNYSITERIISNLLITYPPIIGVTNESKSSTESSKGTHPIYTNRYPYRITNTTSNDFLTIKQPNKFTRGINIADTIALSGSIDFVLGSVDL